jgi:hypothetical protein
MFRLFLKSEFEERLHDGFYLIHARPPRDHG